MQVIQAPVIISIYIVSTPSVFWCYNALHVHLKTTGARGTDLPPPLFLTFCLQIYFQYIFFISLLFHLFFLILTCSCQYSYNLMLTSNCMCRHYIDTNKRSWHGLATPLFSNFLFTNLFSIKFLYFFIENKFVNRKLEKKGGGRSI
jgi:hypothetical protein